jgi:hypothetical protein
MASRASVGRWAGAGKGSPALHTKCVMTAILHQSFMNEGVCLPTAEEKNKAKAWLIRVELGSMGGFLLIGLLFRSSIGRIGMGKVILIENTIIL